MGKNTFILIIFNLVNSSTQFLIILILSKYLNISDYASFRQLFLPFEIAAPLLGLGLSSTIFYFFPRYKNKNRLLQVSISLILISCIIFQITLNLGLDNIISSILNNKSLSQYFYILGLFSFFSLSNTILYSYFILYNKTNRSLIVNFCANIFLVLTLFYFVTNNFSLHSIIILRVLTYGLIFLAMIFNSDIFSDFYESWKEYLLDLKKIFIYSYPLCLSLVIGVLSYKIDKLMISYLTSPEEYAIYINGAFEIPLISVITSSIAGASFGLFTSYCSEGNFELANNLFRKISVLSALFLFPVFVLFFVYADSLINILFGLEYSNSYVIFRIYLLLLPIRIVQYGNVMIAINKTKILLFRSIIELLIGFSLGLALFYFVGSKGVALGFVLSVLLWSVPYNLIIISKGFSISLKNIIPYKSLFLIISSSLISVTLVYVFALVIKNLSEFIKLGLIIMFYGIFYLFSLYFFKVVRFDKSLKYKIKIIC